MANKCSFCGKPNKDAYHAVVDCEEIKECWKAYLPNLELVGQNLGVIEIAKRLIESGKYKEVVKFLCISQSI